MLEDVLGWIVVLMGAILMRFTDITIIDPLMSIGVAMFILINAGRNLREIIDIFLEKTPVDIEEIKEHILEIDKVIDVHHIHIWSMDGHNNYATLHVVANENFEEVKKKVKEELREHHISHVTIEMENEDEECEEMHCHVEHHHEHGHCHHHHHHH